MDTKTFMAGLSWAEKEFDQLTANGGSIAAEDSHARWKRLQGFLDDLRSIVEEGRLAVGKSSPSSSSSSGSSSSSISADEARDALESFKAARRFARAWSKFHSLARELDAAIALLERTASDSESSARREGGKPAVVAQVPYTGQPAETKRYWRRV